MFDLVWFVHVFGWSALGTALGLAAVLLIRVLFWLCLKVLDA